MAIGTTAAIIGSAAIGAGASLAGASKQSSAAKKATQAQTQAADANVALQREIYQDQKQSYQPFRDLELQQANAFGEIFGFNPVGDQQPSYQAQNAFTAGYGPRDHVYGKNTPYATLGDSGGYADRSYSGLPVQNGAQNMAQMAAGQAVGQPQGNPAMARFQESPFGTLLENDLYNTREDLNNAFSAQGLMFSSANDYAQAEAVSRGQSNAFNNYLTALMGSPPTGATGAQANAASAYGANAGNAFTNAGNAQAAGAIAQGNAWAGGLQGVGNAALTGAGLWGQYG